jgi:hypothetical protein
MNTWIHIHTEYMKPQSIVCEGTGERGEKKEIIAGKLHFAVRPTKGVTLTLHVNKFPPLEICNGQLFSLKKPMCSVCCACPCCDVEEWFNSSVRMVGCCTTWQWLTVMFVFPLLPCPPCHQPL